MPFSLMQGFRSPAQTSLYVIDADLAPLLGSRDAFFAAAHSRNEGPIPTNGVTE